ncbi:MAG: T9SS type A sorting domain-containing protein [Ignavibacteria bacterium]|jgi:hypothetical protein
MKFFTKFFIAGFIILTFSKVTEAQFIKFTPKTYIINATQFAINNFAPNATLYDIASAYGLDSTGKANAWQYLFYNPVNDSGYVVVGTVINLLGFIAVGSTTPTLPGVFLRPLGTSFCESDIEMSAVEIGGGRQFRQLHPATRITATVYKYPLSPDTSKAYWTNLYTDTLGTQFQVFVVDGTTCQLVVIGIKPVSSEVPKGFELYQNYPNPFNPVTKIKFAVPKTEFVNVKVYDVLGNKLKQPVNQIVQAGIYEAEFDGSNYSSGLYFYSINVSDPSGGPVQYSETKKMLLVK